MRSSLCCSPFKRLVFNLLLIFHLTLAHFITTSTQPLYRDDEFSALLQCKESFTISEDFSSDPYAYPKVAFWKLKEENSDCCSRDGVECNEDTGHVIRLDLTSSYVDASINSSCSLFKLVYLEWLSLADNGFNDFEIPSGFINLLGLSHLNLSFSAFSVQVPFQILELSGLVSLDLSKGSLSLQNPYIRSLVERLTHLKSLELRDISSPVTDVMANLSTLRYLLETADCKVDFQKRFFNFPTLIIFL